MKTDFSDSSKRMSRKQQESDFLRYIPDELLYAILNNKHDSMIVIDNEGIIRFISDFNKTLTDNQPKSYIGKKLSEIKSASKLMETLKNGKPDISVISLADNISTIVCRIPVYNNGRIIGAIGRFMFTNAAQFEEQRNKINLLTQEKEYFKNKLKEYDTLIKAQGRVRYTIDSILGNSREIKKVKTLLSNASKLCTPVLITGESGTGKELFAHSIHAMSPRKVNNFVKINCAAIPHDLMESELFGYMPGAFTGADKKGKIGKFEKANNGTIFLDEIGDMPMNLQAKLLRVLQEKEVERIGSDKSTLVDFRLVAATNKNLKKLMNEGLFREDLYYRINVINIKLPALRERTEDISILLNHFLKETCINHGLPQRIVNPSVYKILNEYPWKGNIRELQSLAEQLIVRSSAVEIEPSDLPKWFFSAVPNSNSTSAQWEGDHLTLKAAVEKTEVQMITRALYSTHNNKKKTAEVLGIPRSQLYEKIKKYKIKTN